MGLYNLEDFKNFERAVTPVPTPAVPAIPKLSEEPVSSAATTYRLADFEDLMLNKPSVAQAPEALQAVGGLSALPMGGKARFLFSSDPRVKMQQIVEKSQEAGGKVEDIRFDPNLDTYILKMSPKAGVPVKEYPLDAPGVSWENIIELGGETIKAIPDTAVALASRGAAMGKLPPGLTPAVSKMALGTGAAALGGGVSASARKALGYAIEGVSPSRYDPNIPYEPQGMGMGADIALEGALGAGGEVLGGTAEILAKKTAPWIMSFGKKIFGMDAKKFPGLQSNDHKVLRNELANIAESSEVPRDIRTIATDMLSDPAKIDEYMNIPENVRRDYDPTTLQFRSLSYPAGTDRQKIAEDAIKERGMKVRPAAMLGQMINDPKVIAEIEKGAQSDKYRMIYTALLDQDKQLIDFKENLRKAYKITDPAFTGVEGGKPVREALAMVKKGQEDAIKNTIDNEYNILKSKVGDTVITEPKTFTQTQLRGFTQDERKRIEDEQPMVWAKALTKTLESSTGADRKILRDTTANFMKNAAIDGNTPIAAEQKAAMAESLPKELYSSLKTTPGVDAVTDEQVKAQVETILAETFKPSVRLSPQGAGYLYERLKDLTGKNDRLDVAIEALGFQSGKKAMPIDEAYLYSPKKWMEISYLQKWMSDATTAKSNSAVNAAKDSLATMFDTIIANRGELPKTADTSWVKPQNLDEKTYDAVNMFENPKSEGGVGVSASSYLDFVKNYLNDAYDNVSSTDAKKSIATIKDNIIKKIAKDSKGKISEGDLRGSLRTVAEAYSDKAHLEASRLATVSEMLGKDIEAVSDRLWQMTAKDLNQTMDKMLKLGTDPAERQFNEKIGDSIISNIFWKKVGNKEGSGISLDAALSDKQGAQKIGDLQRAFNFNVNDWEKFTEIASKTPYGKKLVDEVTDFREMLNYAGAARPASWEKQKAGNINIFQTLGGGVKVTPSIAERIGAVNPEAAIRILTSKPNPVALMRLKEAVTDKDPERYFSILSSMVSAPTKGYAQQTVYGNEEE